MKQNSVTIKARSLLAEPPHELSRALLQSRFPLVVEAGAPWRLKRPGNWFDLLAADEKGTTWRIATVDEAERLRALLGMMADRRVARQVANGDRVQLHCWSRKSSGGLVVEVIELMSEDFTIVR
jgi:hypothetical protein